MENPYPPPPPPEPQKSPHVALWETAAVFTVLFFVFVVSSVVVYLVLGYEVELIVGELVILLVPFLYLSIRRFNVKEYVKISFHPKYVFLGVACGVLLIFLDIGVSEVLTYFLGTSQAVTNANQGYANLSATPVGLGVVAVALILAGICEEFAFRGFLMNSIFRSLKPKYASLAFPVALLVSSLVFGLFHFDPQGVYIIGALTIGIALGCFYQKWNYTVSATAHATTNMLFLVLLLL